MTRGCPDGKVGELVYECRGNRWEELEDNCVLEAIKNLEEESQVMFYVNVEIHVLLKKTQCTLERDIVIDLHINVRNPLYLLNSVCYYLFHC